MICLNGGTAGKMRHPDVHRKFGSRDAGAIPEGRWRWQMRFAGRV
jgi:hypothetical protein